MISLDISDIAIIHVSVEGAYCTKRPKRRTSNAKNGWDHHKQTRNECPRVGATCGRALTFTIVTAERRAMGGPLYQRTLSPCSNRTVTCNHLLYHKIAFSEVSNILQQHFFDPTHSESREPRSVFFALRRMSCFLAAVLMQNMEAENYTSHVVVRTTLA